MALGSPTHHSSSTNEREDNSNVRGSNNSKAGARRSNTTNNSGSNHRSRSTGGGKNSLTESSVVNSNGVDDFLDAGIDATHLSKTDPQHSLLLQQISTKSTSSCLVAPTVTVTIYIPTAAVGAVIGRKGQTIAQLQKIAAEKASSNHPVRVSVVGREQLQQMNIQLPESYLMATKASEMNSSNAGFYGGGTPSTSTAASIPYTHTELDWSNPSSTPVVIRADPAAALVAATILQDIVLKQQLQQNSNGISCTSSASRIASNSSSNAITDGEERSDSDCYSFEDDVILDVPISRHKHAAVVGKRGAVLASISAEYSVRIMVPPPPLPSTIMGSSERHDIIQLEGLLANVKPCLLKVLQVASGAYSSNANKASEGNKTEDNRGNMNKKQAQPNPSSKPSEGAMGPISHQQTIVLTAPITQAKMRNIGQKTDTTIRKKKKVDDGFSYTVSSTLNNNGASGLTVQQQKTIVENNVNAAVALLQKWNSDNLTATASASASAGVNPSSDSSSNGLRSPRRNNNNRGRGGGGGRGGGNTSNNKTSSNKRGGGNKAKSQTAISKENK